MGGGGGDGGFWRDSLDFTLYERGGGSLRKAKTER